MIYYLTVIHFARIGPAEGWKGRSQSKSITKVGFEILGNFAALNKDWIISSQWFRA